MGAISAGPSPNQDFYLLEETKKKHILQKILLLKKILPPDSFPFFHCKYWVANMMYIYSNKYRDHFHKSLKLLDDNFLTIVSMVIILPLLAISGYIFPQADDFAFRNYLRHMSMLELQPYVYNHTGGRYFANFLLGLVPMPTEGPAKGFSVSDLFIYRTLPALLICFTLFSIYHLSGNLFASIKRGQKIQISLGLMTAFMAFNHPQSIYWYTGLVQYGIAMPLITLFLSYLIRLSERPDGRTLTITALIGILAIGTNETSLVVINLAMIVTCAHMFFYSNRNRHMYLSLYAILVMYTLICLFAPGVRSRDSWKDFPHEKEFFFALEKSMTLTLANSLYWFTTAMLVTIFLIDYVRRKGLYLKPVLKGISSLHFTVFFIASIVLSYFPNAWARGAVNPEHRVVDNIHYLFVVGLFMCFLLFTLGGKTSAGRVDQFTLTDTLRYVLMATLLCNLYSETASKTHVLDLFRIAPLHERELNSRYMKISLANSDTIAVPPLKNLPATIHFDDIRVDAGNWRNKNLSIYFNRKAIKLTSSESLPEGFDNTEMSETKDAN